MLRPSGIGVGDQHIAALQLRGALVNALDIGIRIAADFELKLGVALGAIVRHLFRHGLGALLRNRAVQRKRLAVAAAEQRGDRQSRGFAENVPARHVERRLHVRMAAQGGVHAAVQHAERSGVEPDELRRQFGDSGARALARRPADTPVRAGRPRRSR